MPIASHALDSARYAVARFSRQVEDETVVIGRPEVSVFIAVPVEALEIVDDLAAGCSVGQARERFVARHGEDPDIDGLIGELESRGFLWLPEHAAARSPEPAASKGHFERFPRQLAERLFGRAALTLYGFIVVIAAVVVAVDPGVLPTWRALFFPERLALILPLLLGVHIGALLIHEMAHLVAARAAGISTRLGIGNRLWVIVAEADLTGLWALPRRARYLPLLAGMIADAVSFSCLVLLLEADRLGVVALPDLARLLVRAMTLRYVLALVWQGFFFVRTDLYYVLATALRHTNLLAETETYLRGLLRRGRGLILHRDGPPSASPLDRAPLEPAPAGTAIRAYAVFWVIGRVAAVAVLVMVQIPLAWRYLRFLVASLDPAAAATRRPTAIIMSALVLALLALGPSVWLVSLLKKKVRS